MYYILVICVCSCAGCNRHTGECVEVCSSDTGVCRCRDGFSLSKQGDHCEGTASISLVKHSDIYTQNHLWRNAQLSSFVQNSLLLFQISMNVPCGITAVHWDVRMFRAHTSAPALRVTCYCPI